MGARLPLPGYGPELFRHLLSFLRLLALLCLLTRALGGKLFLTLRLGGIAPIAIDRAAQGRRERMKEWITAAMIGLGLIFAAALAYRWAQEPKIERQLYGCTAKWDAKTQTCKGKWVPLYEQQP